MSTLENDHNVYIVGAGFSADRGLPVLNNFMLAMRDAHGWLSSKGRASEANAIQKVLEYRLRAASAGYRVHIELENIEELFSLASASTDDLSRDIRLAIAATLDYCLGCNPVKRTFLAGPNEVFPISGNVKFESQSSLPNNSGISMPTYEQYVGALVGWFNNRTVTGRNTLISFNYDTLIEDTLSALGIDFTYGLQPNTVSVDGSAKKLRIQSSASVLLLKLHGSVNWARAPDGNLTIFGSYDDVRVNDLVPELVPPTWRKVFGEQLNDIWSGALRAIESATRVIALGFSIPETDLHFKYLLAAGLQNNLSLRQIVAVNRDKKTLEDRLSRILVSSPAGFQRWLVTGNTIAAFLVPGMSDSSIGWYGRTMHPNVMINRRDH